MRSLTYCSFADDDRCLGVLILEGELLRAAARGRADSLGLDPGGELVALPVLENDPHIPPGMFETMASNVNRLVSKDEAIVLFDAIRYGDWKQGRKN